MPGPVLQARIFASTNRHRDRPKPTTRSWTLPCFFCPTKSRSILMGLGVDCDIILHSRIANRLGICDGDRIVFELYELNDVYCFPASVMDDLPTDFMIHGALKLNIIKSFSSSKGFHNIVANSGVEIHNIPDQNMFAGVKMVKRHGMCVLQFGGGSRHTNEDGGTNGYGFYITAPGVGGLVKGYGYDSVKRDTLYMEYSGLLEGLYWAIRLDPAEIEVRGYSSLIFNQLNGSCKVTSSSIRKLLDKISSIILEVNNEVLFTFRCISYEEDRNEAPADTFARMGMDRMENKVTVDWLNVNTVMNQKN